MQKTYRKNIKPVSEKIRQKTKNNTIFFTIGESIIPPSIPHNDGSPTDDLFSQDINETHRKHSPKIIYTTRGFKKNNIRSN